MRRLTINFIVFVFYLLPVSDFVYAQSNNANKEAAGAENKAATNSPVGRSSQELEEMRILLERIVRLEQSHTFQSNKVAELEGKVSQKESELLHARRDIKTLEANLQNSDNRVLLLEGKARQSLEKYLVEEEQKYLEGLKVISSLIRNSGKLKFATDLSANLSAFQRLGNPLSEPIFKEKMDLLKANQGKNQGLLDTIRNSHSAPNSIVSLVVEMGFFMFQDRRSQDKQKDAKDFICIADLAARTNSDQRVTENNLNFLKQQIMTFHQRVKDQFQAYAKSCGEDLNWEKYSSRDSVADPLEDRARKEFFEARTKSSISSRVVEMRYQLELTRNLLLDYDSLIRRVDDFLATYLETLKTNLKETNTQQTCSPQIMGRVTDELSKLIQEANRIRSSFNEDYDTKKDISPRTRSIVFGVAQTVAILQ